jgi:hypothetical protein
MEGGSNRRLKQTEQPFPCVHSLTSTTEPGNSKTTMVLGAAGGFILYRHHMHTQQRWAETDQPVARLETEV